MAEQVGHSLTGKYPTGVFSKSVRLMESVPCGTDSQTAAASAAAWTEMHRWGGNGRGKPTAGWFSMSGQKAAKELRDALVLPAHGAGIRIVTYGLWTRFETRV